MITIEICGKYIEVDNDGHIKNRADWNETVASEIAKIEGIEELNDKHWLVINYMQKVFAEKGEAPSIRRINKESGVNTKEFYTLFPKKPMKKAARISGLPKPRSCV